MRKESRDERRRDSWGYQNRAPLRLVCACMVSLTSRGFKKSVITDFPVPGFIGTDAFDDVFCF